MYSGTPLDIKKIIVLHTLSAYNSLLVRYKVYSSDPRECLCSTWRYAGAYENFIIDQALNHLTSLIKCLSVRIWTKWFWVRAQLHSLKNKIVIWNFQPLTLGENYTEIKAWQQKFPYKNLVRNVVKESKLWNRTLKSAVW